MIERPFVAMQQLRRRPRLAIVGTGLSGAILAELLNPICDLVLFERGREYFERASDFKLTGHQPGYRSFSYGIGGTTNIWTGGLVEMLTGEFSPRWPEQVSRELPPYYAAVVRQLYQRAAGDAWSQRAHERICDDVILTSIYYPHSIFRVIESSLLCGCDVRQDCRLQELHEDSHGVELALLQNGSIATERFDYVILACGGMNSPIPLLRSGVGGSRVGLNFTDHPTGFIAKISGGTNHDILGILKAKSNGMDASKSFVKIRDPQTGLWSAIYLRPAASLKFNSDPFVKWFTRMDESTPHRSLFSRISQLADWDELHRVMENRLGVSLPTGVAYVHVINEQESTGQGTVTLNSNDEPSLTWQISDATIGSIQRNLAAFANLLGADLHMPRQPIAERLFSAAHHSGTCSIATRSQDGVVDENLLLHGADRTYVCDGSVLPSTGASNTGLTIGALAHRLADHLKSIFSRS